MPAKITLTVSEGKLKGQEFAFAETTTCVVGRASDCDPRVPEDQEHRQISRHHCLLDINPPDIRIRDFGSLNGTFVNGQKIGQRAKGQTPEEAAQLQFPEHDLKDGDEIKLGKTVFRVEIYVPAVCTDCSAEIPEADRKAAAILLTGSTLYRCSGCREKAAQAQEKEPPRPKPKRCAKCGRDVAAEVGEHRHGEFVCASCQADPMELIKLLLHLASKGDKRVLAIQGYQIVKKLDEGGMGAVYLAKHEKTGQQRALKVMLPQVAVEERSKQAFLRETENTKALKHTNIVRLYDSGCSNGTFFFTMEFCEGGSVADLMGRRGGKLSVAEAGPLALQALDGLEYAHNAEIPYVKLANGTIGRGRGLVHRDLKPHNLFLSGSGRSLVAKVGDFGLGKAFDLAGLSGHTRTGTMAGTPEFMARQQVVNFKYAKPDVDVWAMVASLYCMLTGCIPRNFPRGKDKWQTVLNTDPEPIRSRDASVPKKLAELLDLALRDRKELHFNTAAAFKQALLEVL